VVPLPEEFIEEEPHSWANLDPSTYALYSTGGFPVAPDSGPNRDSGAFPGRASQVPHSSSRSGNYPALAGATSSPAASSGNYPAVAGPSPASGVPTSSGAYPAVHVPDFQSQYDIGMTYLEAGRYNEAIASLSYAARDPNLEVVCRSLVGSMYLQLGDLDSGIAVLHQALGASVRTREQDVAVGYELGNAYELKGMFEQAAHFFEWLVQLDPNYGDPRGSVRERLARLRP